MLGEIISMKLIVVVSLIANLLLSYLLLDAGITVDGCSMQRKYLNQGINTASIFLNEYFIGKKSTEVINISDNLKIDDIIVKKNEQEIVINDLVFNLDKGFITKVYFLGGED